MAKNTSNTPLNGNRNWAKRSVWDASDHAKEYSPLTLIGTPLDGDIAKGQGNFKNITSVADFHTELEGVILNEGQPRAKIPESIKDYTGFATGRLTSEDVNQTITASKAAFECLLGRMRSVP